MIVFKEWSQLPKIYFKQCKINMQYLIVVAHPDDEVLGCGASIYKWTKKGDVVDFAS